MKQAFTLTLPAGYRLDDVLAFHRRDSESVAEQVSDTRLRKGMLLGDVAAVLDIALPAPGAASVACEIDADEADEAVLPALLEQARAAALNVLGLRIDPAPFLASVADDALLGALVRRQPGLRVVQSATVFEALSWAVIGQQINLPFAIALRRTFIQQAGRQHSSGLYCYPSAAAAARLEAEQLTSRKFSRAKADTLLRLARLVDDGSLQLEPGPGRGIADIAAALLAVKGIGPWTVNYALLRGYGYADCSLHGDVAIRAALQHLLGEDSKPEMARTEQILRRYSPHRTLAAAHLWASLHPQPGAAKT